MTDEPVFTARDFVAYLRRKGSLPLIQPPETAILLYQKEVFDYACRRAWRRPVSLFGATMLPRGRFGLFTGFGSGAAATAALVEQLIAFGVKQFISIGLAGGLQENLKAGDLLVATGAVRDEGVTRHYLPAAEIIDAAPALIDVISQKLVEGKIPFCTGLVWSTDAPFREMKNDVIRRQQSGVIGVDMESAALLGVAGFYGLPALSLFSIADNISGGIWKMPDDLRPAFDGLNVLIKLVLSLRS